MDAFTYNNIFDTKGIEYLVIIGFFAVLIPFWLILSKRVTIPEKLRKLPGILTAGILRVPQGLYFSRNHIWAHLRRNGVAEVGLDDLLVHITGEVDLSELKRCGEKISRGDTMAEISREGKVLKLLSPISGEVVAINHSLISTPSLLLEDPYEKGWIYRIKPTAWAFETSSCFLAGDADNWIGNEVTRFRDFLMKTAAEYTHGSQELILQDGGELRDNTLSEMPGEVWQSFESNFLKLEDKCSIGGICD